MEPLLLSDLHSRNGTLLNGELVENKTSAVFPGDVIRIGNSSLKVGATSIYIARD
jgi:pSer/pThr/pTyr-binding forkhead associated (FHA) protein